MLSLRTPITQRASAHTLRRSWDYIYTGHSAVPAPVPPTCELADMSTFAPADVAVMMVEASVKKHRMHPMVVLLKAVGFANDMWKRTD